MDLILSPDVQQFVDEKVKSGEYARPEDVVYAGLVTLMHQTNLSQLSPEELEAIFPNLRQKIDEGMEDLRAGRAGDGEAFFEELERDEKSEPEQSGVGRKTA